MRLSGHNRVEIFEGMLSGESFFAEVIDDPNILAKIDYHPETANFMGGLARCEATLSRQVFHEGSTNGYRLTGQLTWGDTSGGRDTGRFLTHKEIFDFDSHGGILDYHEEELALGFRWFSFSSSGEAFRARLAEALKRFDEAAVA